MTFIIFAQNSWAISITTYPILGLCLLIWMHFSCWIQLWQWKFETFWKSWKFFACHLQSTSGWRRLSAISRTAWPTLGMFVLIKKYIFIGFWMWQNLVNSLDFLQDFYFVKWNCQVQPSSTCIGFPKHFCCTCLSSQGRGTVHSIILLGFLLFFYFSWLCLNSWRCIRNVICRNKHDN